MSLVVTEIILKKKKKRLAKISLLTVGKHLPTCNSTEF